MSQANPAIGANVDLPPAGAPARSLERREGRITSDMVLATFARFGAISVIAMLAVLFAVLAYAAWPSIRAYGVSFLYTTQWRPGDSVPARGSDGKVLVENGKVVMESVKPVFGVLPAVYGTAVSSLLALVFAVPLSFGTALYLVRLSSPRMAGTVSFLVEFLAAIPSIAYGMWGLFVLAPFLQHVVEPLLRSFVGWVPGVGSWLFTETAMRGDQVLTRPVALTGRDMFCGGLVLAIMILPIITAISRDVLRSVPRSQIEGTLALGATWWQSSWEMLSYSRSALFGAVMLGLARAAGETMAITMVIGNTNRIHASLFAPAQTMSSLLANEFAEASTELHRAALAEVALILLVMSLIFNITARWLVVGKRNQPSAAN